MGNTMMELNTAFHEEAQKQVFNITQVSLNNIPLQSVKRERVRATENPGLLSGLYFPAKGHRETPPGFLSL